MCSLRVPHSDTALTAVRFSDDTAIVGRVSEENKQEYREVITNI